jgi:hypothetical protein
MAFSSDLSICTHKSYVKCKTTGLQNQPCKSEGVNIKDLNSNTCFSYYTCKIIAGKLIYVKQTCGIKKAFSEKYGYCLDTAFVRCNHVKPLHAIPSKYGIQEF